MLVLTRKQNEKICIGSSIDITVVRMKGNAVRLGIEAPRDVNILRGELVFETAANDASGANDGEAGSEKTAAVVVGNGSPDRSLRCKPLPTCVAGSDRKLDRNPGSDWTEGAGAKGVGAGQMRNSKKPNSERTQRENSTHFA